MMRRRVVWSVFRREFLDSIRDFETIATTFGLPLLTWFLGILMGLYVFEVIGSQEFKAEKKSEAQVAPGQEAEDEGLLRVALAGAEIPGLSGRLMEGGMVRVVELDPQVDLERATKEISTGNWDWLSVDMWMHEVPDVYAQIEQLLLDQEVDVLACSRSRPGLENRFEQVIFYDWTKSDSRDANDLVLSAIDELEEEMVGEVLMSKGVEEASLRPLARRSVRVGSLVRDFSGMVVPLMLITFVAASAYAPAVAAIAGEKEANTIVTLMIAPVRSSEVILGKFVNVVLFGLVGAGFYLVPLVLGLLFGNWFIPSLDTEIWPWAVVFLCLVPVTAIYAALAMCVASCARSYKLSQALMLPFMFLFLAPVGVTVMPDVTLNEDWCWIPIASLALLIKAILSLDVIGQYVLPVVGVNFLYGGFALVLAMRIIRLQGGGLSEEMTFWEAITLKQDGLLRPNARFSFVLFTLLLFGSLVLQLFMIELNFVLQICILMLGWLVLVPLGFWKMMRFTWLDMDWLRLPKPATWVGAILLGLGGWSLSLPFFILFPPPESWSETFSKGFATMMDGYSLPVLLLLFAVLPGICEEFVFRGVLMRGLLNTKTLSPWVCILITAIGFGAIHFSFYRFMPVAVLGILLGFVAWQTRSIWPSVLVHVLNNGVIVSVGELASKSGQEMQVSNLTGSILLPELFIGWVLLGLGLWIIVKVNRKSSAREDSCVIEKEFAHESSG